MLVLSLLESREWTGVRGNDIAAPPGRFVESGRPGFAI